MAFNEDTFGIVFLNVDYESSLALCTISKLHKSWCTNYLWKDKVKLDYPFWASFKPLGNMTYHDYYLELYTQYYVTVGSERTISVPQCIERAAFRNSERLIKYFRLLADTRGIQIDSRYLSPPMIRKYSTDDITNLLVSDRIVPENLTIAHIGGGDTSLSYGKLKTRHDTTVSIAVDIGRGGNRKIIEKLFNSVPTPLNVYVAIGAAHAGNYELFEELGGVNAIANTVYTYPLSVFPYNWSIVSKLVKHEAANYGTADNSQQLRIIAENSLHYLNKQFEVDPNCLLDRDESYQNMLIEYGKLYFVPGARIHGLNPYNSVQMVAVLEFFGEIPLDRLVHYLSTSTSPITLARYLIEKKLMAPSHILSVMVSMTDEADIYIKYITQWLKSIIDDTINDGILVITHGILVSEFKYTIDGKSYTGTKLGSADSTVDALAKLIRVVHNIEGSLVFIDSYGKPILGVDIIHHDDNINIKTFPPGKGKITYIYRGITRTLGLLTGNKTLGDLLTKLTSIPEIYNAKIQRYIIDVLIDYKMGNTDFLYPGMALTIHMKDYFLPTETEIIRAIHDTNRVFAPDEVVICRVTFKDVGYLFKAVINIHFVDEYKMHNIPERISLDDIVGHTGAKYYMSDINASDLY